jgi:hypothetical protein
VSRMMVLNLKNTITHNVAQQLASGSTKEDMYEYLGNVATFLFGPAGQAAGLTSDDVYEIYLYAWHHAQAEVEMILEMNRRYGLSLQVKGHGGSQIHPSIALEKFLIE